MKTAMKLAILIFAIAIALVSFTACQDQEDANEQPLSGEEEEPVIRGVCYWECESDDGIKHQTVCYGQGSEAITDSALETEEDCQKMGQSYCDSIEQTLSRFQFDTDCLSCAAEECRRAGSGIDSPAR